jgi:hypothetical protein
MTQEADQSSDVLRSRRQEELLTNKLQPPQTQAPDSHAMLQFRKQCFCLLSRPLGAGERRRVRQFSRPLPCRFVLAKQPKQSSVIHVFAMPSGW